MNVYVDYPSGKFSIRAKYLISMAGEKPARGKDLLKKPARMDNPLILVENGIVTSIRPAPSILPSGFKCVDFGEVCLLPPLVNAHTHLQLSWLKGKLHYFNGFTQWLKSLVPHILDAVSVNNFCESPLFVDSINKALLEIRQSGTKYIGDVGGTITGAIGLVQEHANKYGLDVKSFCEWFGFIDAKMPWPPRCNDEITQSGDLAARCAPAGHALYSTSLQSMQKAKQYCNAHNKIFSFHLGESHDETELLVTDTGPLAEFYRGKVLPESWHPYGMRPLKLAQNTGLLDSSTLAVHGVTLNTGEISLFSESGAYMCLCPRSNHLLNVGTASLEKYVRAGARLCLGTDGLTSNTDLDVRNEALFLLEKNDAPPAAILRMLTVNGADALGQNPQVCQLYNGAKASFAILPAHIA